MKRVGIIANLNKSNAVDAANRVILLLKKRRIAVLLEESLACALHKKKLGFSIDKIGRQADIVIALGGDGTFLRAARITQGHLKPILGVNLGTLGFLAEVSLDEIENALDLLAEGRYNVNYRMTLDTYVMKRGGRRQKVQPALNDVVISKEAIARIINFETYINKKYVANYNGDGIIISTPTGSTAYSLGAGGPVVEPGTDAVLIVPICPHTFTHRPLIVSSGVKIEIHLGMSAKNAVLTIDGQVGLKLKSGDKVMVTKGRQDIPLVTFGNISYFELLREKMSWGTR